MLIGIPIAVILFLLISTALARLFSLDGAEDSAITSLVKAEAAGNSAGMVARIQGCAQSSSCRARVSYDASHLRRSGALTILRIDNSAGFSLSGTIGTARVAWRTGFGLPVVQCVKVHRAGSVLSGFRIELLEVSRRITSDAVCPRHY